MFGTSHHRGQALVAHDFSHTPIVPNARATAECESRAPRLAARDTSAPGVHCGVQAPVSAGPESPVHTFLGGLLDAPGHEGLQALPVLDVQPDFGASKSASVIPLMRVQVSKCDVCGPLRPDPNGRPAAPAIATRIVVGAR